MEEEVVIPTEEVVEEVVVETPVEKTEPEVCTSCEA